MAITQYGISHLYGYGFLHLKGYSYDSSYFITKFTIQARSKETTVTEKRLDWNAGYGYRFEGIKMNEDDRHVFPLFVVFDSDSASWREYFSGMKLAYREDSVYEETSYNVDNLPNPCTVLTFAKPAICTSTEFANNVSKYSDKQIRDFVRKLNALSESAAKWKLQYEATIAAVKRERAVKEGAVSGIESRLSSGFGKYGSERLGASESSRANKRMSPPSEAEQLQWIKSGKCSHCGGAFKGLFQKVCKDCGKSKDY